MFEITFRARAEFTKRDLLRCAPTQHAFDSVQQIGALCQITVDGRQLHRLPECRASVRDDANFVNQIGVLTVSSDQCVTRFVIRDAALFFVARSTTFALGTGNDSFQRVFQIALRDLRCLAPGGEQRGFVDGIRQIRARKSRSLPSLDVPLAARHPD